MKKNNALILDDDVLTGHNLSFALKQLGYTEVIQVQSVEDAVLKLNQTPISIAFINSDFVEEEGTPLPTQLSPSNSLPCVYLTEYQDADTYDALLSHNPVGFLAKTFTQKEVEVTVKQIQFRLEKEKELVQKEKWINSIFHNISDAVIVIDPNEKITFINTSAENLLCSDGDDLVGKSLHPYISFHDDEGRRYTQAPYTKALKRHVPRVEKNIYITDSYGKSQRVNCSSSPIMDEKDCLGAVIGIHFVSQKDGTKS